MTNANDEIQILKFRPHQRETLQGFISIVIPKWGNFIINDIAIFEKGSHRWMTFPSRQYVDKDKKKNSYYCAFMDQEMRKAFEDKVLKAFDLHLTNIGKGNA